MSHVNTPPRPTPKFFIEKQPLSTKKDRGTPAKRGPPRPPIKSVNSVSRIFLQRNSASSRAQAVSFRGDNNSFSSIHYNDSISVSYLNQCFDNVSKLGSGSFGEVFKVRSKEDGKFYAVKVFKERFRGETDRQQKLREVQKQELFQPHPNCVGFVKSWEERKQLYIQTELCQTSLYEYAEENHELSETFVYNCLVDILQAISHLHSLNLVHLDIKPENIFIAVNGVFKLGDFGLVMDLGKESVSDAQEGDPKYLASELMQGMFTKAADIFSLGITMLELASDLDLPSGGEYWHNLRNGILPKEFTRRISKNLLEIIRWMMSPHYKERPTAQQLLSLPQIRKIVAKRKRDRWIGSMKAFFGRLWLQLLTMWFFVLEPVRRLCRRQTTPSSPIAMRNQNGRGTQKTPSIHDCSFNHIDYSYSDDEVFDDEPIFMPPLDLSSSSDSFQPSISAFHNIFNSTPTAPRNNRPASKMSVRTPLGSPYRPDFVNTSQPNFNCSRISDDDPSALNRFSAIDPKNLMDVFDNAPSDEE